MIAAGWLTFFFHCHDFLEITEDLTWYISTVKDKLIKQRLHTTIHTRMRLKVSHGFMDKVLHTKIRAGSRRWYFREEHFLWWHPAKSCTNFSTNETCSSPAAFTAQWSLLKYYVSVCFLRSDLSICTHDMQMVRFNTIICGADFSCIIKDNTEPDNWEVTENSLQVQLHTAYTYQLVWITSQWENDLSQYF